MQLLEIGALVVQQAVLDFSPENVLAGGTVGADHTVQGISTGTGLVASAVPTARTALGRLIFWAIQA